MSNRSEKKLAVVFPGIGYHTDLPLLYYTRKLLVRSGYMLREVHYRGFPERAGDWSEQSIHETTQMALEQANELLYHMDYEGLLDLLFVGKSIGTAVAAAYGASRNLKARMILFTPIEETFRYPVHDAIVFHGTKDAYVTTRFLKEACEKADIPFFVTKDANHSLETGEAVRDIGVLQGIMKEVQGFLADA